MAQKPKASSLSDSDFVPSDGDQEKSAEGEDVENEGSPRGNTPPRSPTPEVHLMNLFLLLLLLQLILQCQFFFLQFHHPSLLNLLQPHHFLHQLVLSQSQLLHYHLPLFFKSQQPLQPNLWLVSTYLIWEHLPLAPKPLLPPNHSHHLLQPILNLFSVVITLILTQPTTVRIGFQVKMKMMLRWQGNI